MPKGWMKFNKTRVLQAIKGSGGNRLLICRRLGCSRDTIYHYIDRYPDIAKAVDDEIESLGDLCEAQLMNKIRDGNLVAILFYAKTKLKNRGYVERSEVDTSQQIVLNIEKDDENA